MRNLIRRIGMVSGRLRWLGVPILVGGLAVLPWLPMSAGAAAGLPKPQAAESVTLSLTPASVTVAPGATVELAVQMEAGDQPVDGLEFEIAFPASLLAVVDADANRSGVQIKDGSTFPTRLINTADNAAGRISYAAGVALGDDARPSGTFTVATVQFEAKAAGSATVQFSGETQVAHDGQPLIVATQGATVNIQSGGSPPPDPSPTASPPATRPAPPQVLGPAGGVQLTDLAPVLRWQQPEGTTQFHVRVIPFNLDGPGINLIIGHPDLVSRSQYQVAAPDMSARSNFVLLPGMSYRWEVRVATVSQALTEDAPEWSAWSQGDFRTPTPSSSMIHIIAPPQGGVVDSLTPTLRWDNSDPSIFYYEIQVSQDPAFNDDPATAIAAVYWELVHGGVTNPTNSYTISPSFPLEPQRQYHWRVRPRVQGDGAPVAWSATWDFRTP